MAASSSQWGDPTVIPQLVAQHIHGSGFITDRSVTKEYLTGALGEITPQTQIAGAALLQVQVNDPNWKIARSGLLDVDADGFLPQVDVNFPEGSPVWWRLAMSDLQTVDAAGGSPNLTLTFRHRIIDYLIDCWGPLGWPHGKVGTTFAQFVKMLVDRMPGELPKTSRGPGAAPAIKFVCPAINEIQPIASSNVFGSQVVTAAQASAQNAGINKLPALTAASKVTIKGAKPSQVQIETINTLLGVGQALKAPTVALVAIIYAGMGETSLGADQNTYSNNGARGGGYWGVLQANAPVWPDPHDTTGMATAFFTGTGPQGQTDFHTGAINFAKQGVTNPAEIAIRVEVPSNWPDDAYRTEWSGGAAQGIAEATAIVNAFTGGDLGNTGITATPTSDLAELTRGTSDNPDEDSWTCIQRLAGERNWFCFSSPSGGVHHGKQSWGNYLYLMDGPGLAAQRPVLYLELSPDGTRWSAKSPDGQVIAGDGVMTSLHSTVDNTAVKFSQTRKVKGKVQRKTRTRTPQTPSQVMFNLLCGVLEFNAGQVAVFHEAGPLNSRWIMEDVTQNMLGDVFGQFTLGPPTFPYPEPQANSVAALGANVALPAAPGAPGSSPDLQQGAIEGVAQAALLALAQQQQSHPYQYSEAGNRGNNGTLFGPAPRTMDCSSFATLCYKAASLPDPNHQNYSPIGNTTSLIAHCRPISQGDAKPGDLCFFGSSRSATTHVNVYVGNGESVSMGHQGEPAKGPAAQMGPSGFLGYWRSDVAAIAPPSTTAQETPALQNPAQQGVTSVRQDVGQGQETFLGGIFGSLFGGK